MTSVKKAVLPVAGFGTRFLPATKSVPKEMMPVVDKPLIHYAVEEALASGIEDIIFVTGRGKQAIEDYFDHAYELEDTLEKRGDRDKQLASIRDFLLNSGQITYVRQMKPKGLGHAVWCARDLIGDEPFAVLSPDDLILSKTPCLSQLMSVHGEYDGNVIAAMPVDPKDVNRYGIISPSEGTGSKETLTDVAGLVEKPAMEDAPSNLAIIGRYILDQSVMRTLNDTRPGFGGEIQLTDAMASHIGHGSFKALAFEGKRFDCGTRHEWLEANIAFSLAREDMAHNVVRAITEFGGQYFKSAS